MINTFSSLYLKQMYETGYKLLEEEYAPKRGIFNVQLHKPTVVQRIELAGRKSVELSDLYEELLMSLRNRLYMTGLVQEDEVQLFRKPLCDFEPGRVARKYRDHPRRMATEMLACMRKPKSKVQWGKYCKGAYDGAVFLSQFKGAQDFYKFAKQYNSEIGDRWMLAVNISSQIRGMGTALACNFLKESGLMRYSKPDTQVIGLLEEIGLSPDDQYGAFWTMAKIAEAATVTDFAVDKIFWLLATGRWTEHMDIEQKMDRKRGKELKEHFEASVRKLQG